MNDSETLYRRACEVMPGGVNSPVRAFQSVPSTPRFFSAAEGCRVRTAEGRELVDFCMSWGPLILGHAHPRVLERVREAVGRGLSFGACHAGEIELAERILRGFTWADQVRLVNSGTEAVMTAVRLARGITGRDVIVKFQGGYHGHVDALLVKAGSGLVTQGLASSAGVTGQAAGDTVVLPFDDEEAVSAVFAELSERIAAVVVEPMPANNGLLVQRPEFLAHLRAQCDAHGALLVFDEVISGFRLHYGGYGDRVDVQPDLVTLGKIIGGGMPIGALVGPSAHMQVLAPTGPVYQAGTLSGNPVSTAAGSATLELLEDGAVYGRLDALGDRLAAGLASRDLGIQAQRQGSIVWLYASEGPLPRTAAAIDDGIVDRFAGLHAGMLAEGFYLPPSAYEVLFLSAAHSADEIDAFVEALARVAAT